MNALTRHFSVHQRMHVAGEPCMVDAVITETVSPLTGDQTETVSVNQILDVSSGQLIHTKTLSHDELRQVARAVKIQHFI